MHPSAVAPSGRHLHLMSGCNLQAALSRGLLPDDETLKQLILDPELPLSGRDISLLRWPEEPLRFVLTSRPQAQKCPAKGSCNSHRDCCICDGLTQDSAGARGSMPACHPCWGFIYMLTSMQGHCRGWVSAGSARSTRLCSVPCRDPFWSLSASTRRLCWGVGGCDHLLNSGLRVALYTALAESITTFCLVWTLH